MIRLDYSGGGVDLATCLHYSTSYDLPPAMRLFVFPWGTHGTLSRKKVELSTSKRKRHKHITHCFYDYYLLPLVAVMPYALAF